MITRTFCIQAGAAIRGSVKSEIRRGAYLYGVELTIEEDKRFLTSVYYFTVHGEANAVYGFCEELEQWYALNAD